MDYGSCQHLTREVKDCAIFMINTDGKILTWNLGAQLLKGYTAQEVIGQHFSIFYEPEDIANKKPQRELEKAATEGTTEDEGWRLRKDGTRFWAKVVITALHDGQGKLTGFVKITRDISESRKAEEAFHKQAAVLEQQVDEQTIGLEKANRTKDEFIATLSHELRTPLTSISGWVQMLKTGRLSPAQQGKALEVIDRNLVAEVALIDHLLNVSAIIAGDVRIDLQLIYPAPLIEQCIDSLLPAVEEKGLKLTHDLDTGLGPMRIDPRRFHQILWNLLTNAVKFTPKGGIHITFKGIDNHALLQVSDSGEGIDPDFLPYIFDRFRQADSSRSRKYGGLGIGLTIAKYLVELHGGTICAQSAGLGKGCTFNLTFPIPAPSSNAGSGPERAVRGESTLKDARVLVVEDEEDNSEMIAQALKQHGATPVQADSAEKALHLLEEEPCDLVLCDIGMPDLDGYAFIRKLRSMESPISQVPAAALTAHVSEEDRRLSIEAGFNAYIAKPVTITELIRVSGKLIDEHRPEHIRRLYVIAKGKNDFVRYRAAMSSNANRFSAPHWATPASWRSRFAGIDVAAGDELHITKAALDEGLTTMEVDEVMRGWTLFCEG
jgi:PAS domain S-box-containing protein